MEHIPMVDLKAQYLQIQAALQPCILQCAEEGKYIQGRSVAAFENALASYTGMSQVISCGNGTDALQLAVMALNLPKGSKIIVPAFTFIAPVEVISFLGYEPIYADIDPTAFNITLEHIHAVYTSEVSAIIVVHLFGLPCKDIDRIYAFCNEKNIALIEDNAQSLGAEKAITRKSIITTSFFPTKNLGAMGDGGAVLCNDMQLATRIRKLASHGQSAKYTHDSIGINSRLDTLQAAILSVKLTYLDFYNAQRKKNALYYQEQLQHINEIQLPQVASSSIFHAYTLKVANGKRNALAAFLKQNGIETTVNYPIPAYRQNAYLQNIYLANTEEACASVLSIPVYPEITEQQINYICNTILKFFTSE